MPAKEVLEEPVGAEASLEYISIGCNRMPHALDWGDNGLIAFGACNSVAIYEPQVLSINIYDSFRSWKLCYYSQLLCLCLCAFLACQ